MTDSLMATSVRGRGVRSYRMGGKGKQGNRKRDVMEERKVSKARGKAGGQDWR